MKKLLLTLALLCFGGTAGAQALVDCAPSITCDQSTGPVDTGTGDPAWKMAGKFNYDIGQIWTFLGGLSVIPQSSGGTGATSLAAANIPVLSGTINTGHCASFASATSIGDSGAACGSGVISGTYTSTQVIADFAPASYTGATVFTTDMGRMQSDGNGWRVLGTPPIPPGAQVLSYTHNAFTLFPTLADITAGNAQTLGGALIYPGYIALGSATIGSFSTASNGQLQLAYTGTAGQNGMFTIVPYTTAVLGQDYGQLALQQGGRGFYVEIAYTDSSNNTDCNDTLFVEPQEHNPLQVDFNPNFAGGTGWEQWHEFDVNECGHGTDYSGAYRGAYIKWWGKYNWSNTFTAAPSGTWTGSTLSSAWTGETGSYTITLSTAQQITGNFTNGSTAVTGSATITGTPTATFTTTYGHPLDSSITQTASLDYTTEHIFGGAYDPVGQTWCIWQDRVEQGCTSTAYSGSPDTYRDAWHYMIIVAAQSHGAHVAHTMTVRYVAMWVP